MCLIDLPKVNILHIRALVKADTVVLFDTYGSADSRLHSVFLYHLEVRATARSSTAMRFSCFSNYSSTTLRLRMGDYPTSFGRQSSHQVLQ